MDVRNLRKSSQERKAISPIIATLLLIVIAIAAGVVVYAYVVGFVGNSTSNTGNSTSIIKIDNACVSTAYHCTSGSGLYVVVRNVGSTTLSGNASVYLTDITASSSPSEAMGSGICTASGGPGTTFVCSATGAWTNAPSPGDTISVKIVVADGGETTISVQAIA